MLDLSLYNMIFFSKKPFRTSSHITTMTIGATNSQRMVRPAVSLFMPMAGVRESARLAATAVCWCPRGRLFWRRFFIKNSQKQCNRWRCRLLLNQSIDVRPDDGNCHYRHPQKRFSLVSRTRIYCIKWSIVRKSHKLTEKVHYSGQFGTIQLDLCTWALVVLIDILARYIWIYCRLE